MTDSDPAAWTADDMRDPTRWTIVLSEEQLAELMAVTAQTQAAGLAIHDITRENFVLPTLVTVLEAARQELVGGRGFLLLRGLPVEQFEREQTVRAYFGIGAHFGTAVPQNAQGHLVGHVKDLGNDPRDPKTRIYTTNYRQPFHVDSCDIVGLLCLQPAKSGGASAICSSTAIYREIERTRPDLAAVLRQPFIYDRKGEVPAGKGPHYAMPIAHEHAGQVTVYYARDFIEAAQARFAGEIPPLTLAQTEALDMMDRLAASDSFRLDMDFRAGDIQFLHNHQILHARTGYEDWPEPARKRHLIRLWLSAHGGRPLPPVFEERYGPIRPGQPRGGIHVPGVAPTTPLEAE